MSADTIEVTLGRMPLRVPVVIDEATTRRVAARVNARLRAYEDAHPRVDDYAFALMAAMAFAGELEQRVRAAEDEIRHLTQSAEQDNRELAQSLSRIAGAIQAIRAAIDEAIG